MEKKKSYVQLNLFLPIFIYLYWIYWGDWSIKSNGLQVYNSIYNTLSAFSLCTHHPNSHQYLNYENSTKRVWVNEWVTERSNPTGLSVIPHN